MIARGRLRAVLGIEPMELRAVELSTVLRDGYVCERIGIESSDGTQIRGILTRPASDGRHPAILYAHAHGAKYEIGADELTEGRPALLSPLGPVLARAGYVTLCIDMPTFGTRQQPVESAAAKALLWYGKSLFGQMLSEQAGAVGYLAGRPDVDPARIGIFGLSMGATIAYWLGAVDERIAAVAHLCCYADLASLVATGAHDLHGIYMTVPGLLAETSTGEIAGLVAPRPQLICVGEDDPLTPPPAIDRALAQTRAAYGDSDALEVLRQPGVGHRETPEMRAAVLAFFAKALRPA
jgi:dienelactone hydrolase